jgi:hypothetical protein
MGGRLAGDSCVGRETALRVNTDVPAGSVIVVTVIYRFAPEGPVDAEDDAGNLYQRLPAPSGADPRIGVALGRVDAPLRTGDRIRVTHPDGRGIAVFADWVVGADVSRVADVLESDTSIGPGAEVLAPAAGVTLALLGNNATATFSPASGWAALPDLVVSCGGALGQLGARAFYRPAPSGPTVFAGTLSERRDWSVRLLAFW